MARVKRLWVGMQTRDKTDLGLDLSDAGTDSSIVLSINQQGIDRLHHTFPDTSQDDQEKGKANLYEVNVSANGIDSSSLNDSSIRIHIRGDDQWLPEHIIVWGEADPVVFGGSGLFTIVPLAIDTDLDVALSTDASEGVLSIPLRRLRIARSDETIRRLLIMLTTSNTNDSGTTSLIELDINDSNSSPSLNNFRPRVLGKKGKAHFELTSSFGAPFGPAPNRDRVTAVTLRIAGDDAWVPTSFFLFGLTRDEHALVPLVHVPSWDLGTLSTDLTEGRASVPLPLVPIPPERGGGPILESNVRIEV